MNYMVKGVSAKLTGYNDFQYPWRGHVAAPDWNDKPECGGGLHGIDAKHYLYNIKNGCYIVIAYTDPAIAIGVDKIKVPRGEVVYLSKRIKNIQAWIERHGDIYRGYASTLTGGYASTLTGGDASTLTGGDASTLTGGYASTLTGGDRSTLTGGDRSTLTGGYRSTLIIRGTMGTIICRGDCAIVLAWNGLVVKKLKAGKYSVKLVNGKIKATEEVKV